MSSNDDLLCLIDFIFGILLSFLCSDSGFEHEFQWNLFLFSSGVEVRIVHS